MAKKEAWALKFFDEFGIWPIAGGDGTGDAPAGAGAGGTGDAPAGAGGSGSVPNFGNGGGAPPAAQTFPEFATLIPTEYKDKPWIKDVKDVPGMFKRFDGMLTEMGKRPAGIPADTAPETEWQAFNKAWGVPDKPEAYTLPDPPEGLPKNEKFTTGIKAVLHKAGVNPRQAKILSEGYNALSLELVKEAGAAGQQADVDFDKLADETFGQAKPEVMKNAKALIAKYSNPKFQSELANMDSKTLVQIAGIIDGIRKEFISEDRLPQGGSAPVGMTQEQRQAKGRELMASGAYQNPFHPDHEKTKAEVQKLYGTAPAA